MNNTRNAVATLIALALLMFLAFAGIKVAIMYIVLVLIGASITAGVDAIRRGNDDK